MIGDAVPGGAAPPRPPDDAARLADLRALGATGRGSDPELDSLADLAGNLGMEVVAEGVEEPAQRSAVISCGIRLAQGFLFGRPAPVLERAS